MDRWQRPTPHAQVAATVVDGQAVIVMADSGQVTVLNDVGTRIWQLSDGKHSVDEIVQTIVAEYEVTPDDHLVRSTSARLSPSGSISDGRSR
jgi:hypothetical protein